MQAATESLGGGTKGHEIWALQEGILDSNLGPASNHLCATALSLFLYLQYKDERNTHRVTCIELGKGLK